MHQFRTLIIIIFFFNELLLPADCKYGYGMKYNGYTTTKGPFNMNNFRAKSMRGTGISAWGIVILVVMFILIGVGSYYAGIFYPLICKKERKYDRIELATV